PCGGVVAEYGGRTGAAVEGAWTPVPAPAPTHDGAKTTAAREQSPRAARSGRRAPRRRRRWSTGPYPPSPGPPPSKVLPSPPPSKVSELSGIDPSSPEVVAPGETVNWTVAPGNADPLGSWLITVLAASVLSKSNFGSATLKPCACNSFLASLNNSPVT